MVKGLRFSSAVALSIQLLEQTNLAVKTKKPAIMIHHIKADTMLELAEAYRTKEQGPRIALQEVVGSVEDTLEEYAM